MALQFLNEDADMRIFHITPPQQTLKNGFELSGCQSGSVHFTQ